MVSLGVEYILKVEIRAFTVELNVRVRWDSRATGKKHVSLWQFEAVQ